MIDLALAIIVVTLLAYHYLEARAWTAERSRLLDRVMSRSYNEFMSTATLTTDGAETLQMTSDEAEAAWHQKNMAAHPELYPDGIE